VDAQSKGRYRQVELSKLKKRIAKDMGVSSHALSGGSRSENVSRATKPFMRLLLEWNGTVDWTRKPWKDGAGKIYCINWQRPLLQTAKNNGC
jgi:hypothetical protein